MGQGGYPVRIGIDLDGVVFDTIGELVRLYNLEYDDNLQREDIKSWETARFVKCGEEIYRYFYDEAFYANLPLMDGVLEVMGRLDKKHELVLVSDTPAVGMVNRSRQLEKVFPVDQFRFMREKNIIYTARKDLVDIDLLLDDKPENIEDFHRTGKGWAVVFDWPYNRHLRNYRRIKNWWEFEELIESHSRIGALA
jgi:5'-nucleotidase